jgi:uracil-DNA glycosylase
VQGRRADGQATRVPRVVNDDHRQSPQMDNRCAMAGPRRNDAEAGGGLRAYGESKDEGRTLQDVRSSIITCERCPRLREYCLQVGRERRRAFRDETYWARPVPGFGDPHARLLILGLAPAAHGANRTGRVFTGDGVGASGDFLMAALHRSGFANIPTSRDQNDGLALHDAYIAAAVRCAPPDNKPTPEEIASCLPHLDAEIDALPNLRVVVALGRIAFDAYLQLLKKQGMVPRPRPQFAHGTATLLPNQQLLMGSYHPSRQNTNTGRLTPRMLANVFREARNRLTP